MAVYSFEDIIRQITTKKVHPVYVLQGDEPYFIDLLTQKFIDLLLPEEEKVFNQEVLYGKETNVSTIIDYLGQYPMGSDFKLIVVKNASELKNIDSLSSYVSDPYPSSVLVLALPGKKLDGRKKLSSIVKANFALFESKVIYENQLPAWIKSEVESKGKKISELNAALIGEFLGNDLQKISNEIGKTIIAMGEEKEINRHLIENYIGINREFNVFELINAIFNKDNQKAQLIVNYLADNFNKQPFTLILGSIFNSFVKLYTLKVSRIYNDADIATIINTRSISAIKEYKTALANYSLSDLDHATFLFKLYDQYSKGVDYPSGFYEGILKELVFKLIHIHEITNG